MSDYLLQTVLLLYLLRLAAARVAGSVTTRSRSVRRGRLGGLCNQYIWTWYRGNCGASEAHLIPDVGSRYIGYRCGSLTPGGAGPHDAALGHWSPHQELVQRAVRGIFGISGRLRSGVERCTGGRERGGRWRPGGVHGLPWSVVCCR